ncbi:type I DNA topoisomerase [Devosia neptuniae]|jgi:DNA topoisomerase-1|uniref:type I DNA topoisomerase n=1 Tax=Devosia TaxID=46913 RepID=UPI0022AF841D|nr:type I DNA topoisomerase [Devosia neptuniae]MCZ4345114.1 type I DNA topoisomerase [Devosia neptuniae]|tara:strand:+ start:8857 stop:11493 length:2637 start_codon:yes stop_codon:yes gene_type:complete
MKVVVVESPAKAKTINKYLGSDYHVLASFGHVRDLPAKDGSVRPDEDFAMSWEVDTASKKRIADIANALKGADELILATDPDREGEAISWHVLDVLRQKKAIKKDVTVRRVLFNAITKDAILAAMQVPREIDMPLVDAYLARRALDYLVGFTLSPILWRKLPGSRSAGRVQSVALRLVSDRESEIEKFKPDEYWSVEAKLAQAGKSFLARLLSVDGKKTDKLAIQNGENAAELKKLIEAGQFNVSAVDKKPTKRNPYAPFTTSSLQQDASSRLSLSPSRTMQIAQRLYEDGLITYMRTDAVQMAPEGIAMARSVIGKYFGEEYLPEKARIYQTKAKNAQEAHEAIRPTDMFKRPENLSLDADQAKLYGLIWRRTLASQMKSAEIDRTTVDIAVNVPGRAVELRAVGSVVSFPGFLKLYGVEVKSDEDTEDEDSRELPPLAVGDKPDLQAVDIEQHFTQPPSRYTEASLIKKMEELGIGRPSTYAATLTTLKDRDYVRLEGKALHPEDRGRIVTAFLENFFNRYVEYGFTAGLEEQLDEISAGHLEYKQVLRDFWKDFTAATTEIKDLRVSEVLDVLNDALASRIFPPKEDGSDPRRCPTCGEGQLSLKLGKFGAFIGCSNYPECKHTMQLSDAASGQSPEAAAGDGVLGTDPESGEEVFLKTGRFGPYVQLGDAGGKDAKRSSIPKGWDAAATTLESALKLLSLPRDVGLHPESGLPITAGLGRYGPFILCDGKYANLPDVEEVFTVGLNRAVDLLAQKAAGGFKRGGTVAAIQTFEHDNGPITVRAGRYGPYVNQGKINATIPKDIQPEAVTLEQAVEWIAARAEATGKKVKKAPAKKAAAKKPAAKKAPAKTAAAKKPAPKKAPAKKTVSDEDVPF